MHKRKSDVATRENTSWDWATEEMLEVIRTIAESAARNYQHLNADDVFQDMCLYIAVRPNQQVKPEYIVRQCQSYARDLARRARVKAEREPSFEEIFTEYDRRWE
jgi:hypothetical protein